MFIKSISTYVCNLKDRLVFSAKFGFYREMALRQARLTEQFLLEGSDAEILIPVFRADKYVNLVAPDDGPNVMIMRAPKNYIGESNYAIYTNRQFMEWFQGRERMSMYMHEIGHITLGHHLTTEYLVINPQYEIDADLFAVQSGYGSELSNCLGKMVSFCKAVHPGKYSVLEEQLLERIRHIKTTLQEQAS